MRLCPLSLALASSIPVLGLESVCPRKGCPWPRIFFVSLALASSLVSSTPPLAVTTKIISCKQQMAYAGVVKYEPSLYFRQICNSCMSTRAFSPSLQSKLFSRSIPNPNECTHERSKSALTHIHKSQRFQNKADGLIGLYLTTPVLCRAIQNYLLKVATSTMLLHNHNHRKNLSPPFLISGWASRCRAAQILPYLLLCCYQD